MHQNRSKVGETSNQFRNVVQLFERQLNGGPLTTLKNHTFGSSIRKLVILTPKQYNKVVLCQLQRGLALRLRNKSVTISYAVWQNITLLYMYILCAVQKSHKTVTD